MADFRVLVVEDSPTMRQLIIFALKRLRNLEIVEANDGVEGLKKMSEKKFDLVLTDINMPVMDGIKLITLIRKDDTHKDVPIVVITTEGGSDDREKALSLGANTYITKPIQAAHVLTTVKQLLNIQ
ncbi:MAG: response regulator [Chrysiogenetes bacterium]|nr:response regulator [Chrysiogenetes bacterium]